MYNINGNFLQYNAIKAAIPFTWRQKLKTMKIPRETIHINEEYMININNSLIPLQKITNKHLYWKLVKAKQTEPIIKDKWNTEFGILNKDWTQIFTILKIINDTKIRMFQYKLLFNLIPCNLYLFRIKRSNSFNCLNCNEVDNVTHYIYSCNAVLPFWNTFERWWNRMTNETKKIDKKMVILGDFVEKKQNTRLNACLLIAKWYIYVEKLNDNQIFVYKFLCHIKNKIRIEKIIYTKKDNITKFLEVWGQIEEYIT